MRTIHLPFFLGLVKGPFCSICRPIFILRHTCQESLLCLRTQAPARVATGILDLLNRQQLSFPFQPSRKAAKPLPRSQYPMARDDQRNWICPTCSSHRSRRTRLLNPPRQLRIRNGLAQRDPLHLRPNFPAKLRMLTQVQWRDFFRNNSTKNGSDCGRTHLMPLRETQFAHYLNSPPDSSWKIQFAQSTSRI